MDNPKTNGRYIVDEQRAPAKEPPTFAELARARVAPSSKEPS